MWNFSVQDSAVQACTGITTRNVNPYDGSTIKLVNVPRKYSVFPYITHSSDELVMSLSYFDRRVTPIFPPK